MAKALPQHLARRGHDVRIIMPFYKTIKRRDEATLLASRWLPPQDRSDISYRIHQLELDGICVYLLDCPHYFDRPQLYAENNQAYPDNGERFAFLAAAACMRANSWVSLPTSPTATTGTPACCRCC